ncbi:MAG: DUF1080 domain-containing protein [Gemmataceae bacterium]|nr:DUF1080 domain-containing protein [Gemmataceae bacterium]
MKIASRIAFGLVIIVLGLNVPISGQDKDKKAEKDKKKAEPKKQPNVFTDIATAPIDYKIQGEYAASGDAKASKAAQVIARGNGKFDVYLLEDGLPGAGWDVKSKKLKVEAKLDAEKGIAVFAGMGVKGTIDAAKGTLVANFETATLSLTRTERTSPTMGAKAPEGAIILFDGKNASEWNPGKMVGDLLGVPNNTKKSFTNFKLHIEFRTPFQPTAGGQGRGNSGVYVCGREVQVLDSFGLAGKDNECGGLYGYRAPDVNMCYPPLVWQTYDIEHRPGKIDPQTKKQDSPTITVRHNGMLVHDNYVLKGAGSKGNINLQDHGNPVVYRNAWLVETK